MPPVIAVVAAFVATYATAITIATVVVSAGMAVYGSAQARRAERDAKNQALAAMKDRTTTRVATEAPHRHIYGRAKVGADIVAMFTSGDRDQFKHLVCVHAAHECDAIEEVWVNNALVSGLDASGDPTTGRFAVSPDAEIVEEQRTGPTFTLTYTPRIGSVWVFSGSGANMIPVAVTGVNGRTVTVASSGPVTVSYEYAVRRKISDFINEATTPSATNPVVRVQKHLGGANDVADAYLRSVVGDKWPVTAVLRGLCYTVITLDLNHPEFQSGIPPIHAVIRGKKLYDPRDGQTRWSQNPALAIRDYLTGPLCAVPAADLPTAQFITAANVCDEASPTGGVRYTLNGTVTSDQGQASVLEAMTQAMAGGLVATTWDVYAGKYVAPVAALLQSDIVGGLSVTPGVSDASIYNGVKGQYIGPENKYVQTDFKPYQNSAYRQSDGRDLYNNLDFPFTDSLQRVTNLARVFTEDQRNGFTIRAEFSLKAWPLKVGQRITFTSAVLGHNAKVFRITDKSYSPTSAVQLTLKEDAASIWDYADATVLDSTPNSDLSDPWKIDAPASLSCTSGEAALLRQADGTTVPRIMVSWPTMAQANGVQIEVEWRAVQSTTWERTTVSASETRAYLSPITPGFFYIVRARAVNPSLGVRSNWIATVYQVEVFTARPTVYIWSVDKPAAPTGSASYAWSTGTFGAAPAGYSLAVPPAPANSSASLWAATVPVSDVTDVATPFDWARAELSNLGYDLNSVLAGLDVATLRWDFNGSAQSWTASGATIDTTTDGAALIWTPTAVNATLSLTIPAASRFKGSDCPKVRVRVKRISGTGAWEGNVYYSTAGHGNVSTNRKAIAAPSNLDEWNVLEWDMENLTAGGTDWMDNTIQGLRLDLISDFTTAPATAFKIDWIGVGKFNNTGVSPAQVQAAQAAADAANAAIADMARDDLLSPAEKPAENLRWNTSVGEQPGIDAAAAALGITTERTAYSNAFTTLNAYITGFGAAFTTIPGTAISIVGATYRANFKNYFDAKQALLNAIAAKSATTANYDSVTGRPYDVSNLVKKGTFEDGSLGTWSSGFVEAVSSAGTAYKNQLTTVARDVIENGNKFPVIPGEKLYFLANLNALVTGFTCAFGVVAYDKNNVATYCQVCYRSPGQGFGLVEGILTVPAGAVAATPWLQQDGPSGFTGNYLGANGLWIGRHAPGATVGATWGVNVGGSNKPADNATVGAPAGTNVGSTPATVIEQRANSAIPAPTGFTLTGTFGGTVSTASTGVQTLTKQLNASASGASGAVMYSWVINLIEGGGTIKISSTTDPNPVLTGIASNMSTRISVTCTALDTSTGLSRVNNGVVTMNFGAV